MSTDLISVLELLTGPGRTLHEGEEPPTHIRLPMALAKEILAAMRSRAEGVPDGWKLVPIEPTSEMLESTYSCLSFWIGKDRAKLIIGGDSDEWPNVDPGIKQSYLAMLSAAPTPPGGTKDEG